MIWKKEYETGFEKIDNQHKQIVELIEKLDNSILLNNDDNVINNAVMDLKIYSISHLDYEEQLFKKYKYIHEESKEHIDKHNAFRNKISEFMITDIYLKSELAYKISTFLKDWLINHILETDTKFVKFLRDEGKI